MQNVLIIFKGVWKWMAQSMPSVRNDSKDNILSEIRLEAFILYKGAWGSQQVNPELCHPLLKYWECLLLLSSFESPFWRSLLDCSWVVFVLGIWVVVASEDVSSDGHVSSPTPSLHIGSTAKTDMKISKLKWITELLYARGTALHFLLDILVNI